MKRKSKTVISLVKKLSLGCKGNGVSLSKLECRRVLVLLKGTISSFVDINELLNRRVLNG